MIWLLLVPVYFLGTFPSAVMVARSRGIDITKVGSGNPGASNIARTMGTPWGVAVFALDALKGIIPAATGIHLADNRALGYGMLAASILGHMFPVTRRFVGGKGVATMAGAAFVFQPLVSLILLAVWAITRKVSNKASIASIAIVVGLPLATAIKGVPAWETITLVGINSLLLLRHLGNIKRLLKGKELSASRSRRSASSVVQMTDRDAFNQQIINEFRANGGNVGGNFDGLPMALVTHTGAKSGTRRTTPLVCSMDGDDVIIIASMGGAPANPAWFHNIVANPAVTVEIGADAYEATALDTTGDERQRLWDAHCAKLPFFNEYQAKTDRVIPVLRLVRS